MGLKDLLRRWSKGEDARVLERAEEESRMTPYQRDVDREDFEARKDDVRIGGSFAGSEAEAAASDDLDSD